MDFKSKRPAKEKRILFSTKVQKMRASTLAVFVLVIGVVLCAKYTTKYDNVDLDQILKSDRLLNNYIDCVMDRKPCTPDGQELKRDLPDALVTDCSECSEKQMDGTKKVIKHLIQNKPEVWKEVVAKYDPEGVYRTKHKADFEKEGIVLPE